MSNDDQNPADELSTNAADQADSAAETSAETQSNETPVETQSKSSEASAPAKKASSGPKRKAPQKSGATGAITAFALIGLVIGGASGWFGHGFSQKKAAEKATGACDSWKTKVCTELGENSMGCRDAASAKALLPTAACVTALDDIQTTVRSAKAARAVCDTLVTRLCAEIGGPTTATCKMITEQTQMFPVEHCTKMTEQYDKVAESVRQLAAQQEAMGAMRPGGGPPGMPPGASPHGPGPHAAAPPAEGPASH
jgi:hypothetical protein